MAILPFDMSRLTFVVFIYFSDASDLENSDKEEAQNPEESECSVECSKVSIKEQSPNQSNVQEASSQLGT